jgi:hypothetical protein
MIAAALPKRLSGKGLDGCSTFLPGSGVADLDPALRLPEVKHHQWANLAF